MAQYELLPIYREAMRLAVHLENIVRGFARYHKYTLGSELRNGSRRIVELIIKGNSSAERETVLLKLRDLVKQVKVTAIICQEVKGFKTFSGFTTTVEGLVLMARQNVGWLSLAKSAVSAGS